MAGDSCQCPVDPDHVPVESCERLARRPVQLAFDGFIIGPAEGGLELRDSPCGGGRDAEAGRARPYCEGRVFGLSHRRSRAPSRARPCGYVRSGIEKTRRRAETVTDRIPRRFGQDVATSTHPIKRRRHTRPGGHSVALTGRQARHKVQQSNFGRARLGRMSKSKTSVEPVCCGWASAEPIWVGYHDEESR